MTSIASLLSVLQLFLSLRAQMTPPSQPPAPAPVPASFEPESSDSGPQGSPGASAPFSWPSNGNVYCCSQWYNCYSGYHCEAFYPSCLNNHILAVFPTAPMEKPGWIAITVPRRIIVTEALDQFAILPATVCVIGELTASMAIALNTIRAPTLRPSDRVHY